MNTTYINKLRADEAKIAADNPLINESAMLERIGRNSALSHYYAGVADFEAAQRQRLSRDPKALINVFCDQIAGPTSGDIHTLLHTLFEYLAVRPELADVRGMVEEAASLAEYHADQEKQHSEDPDTIAAARSDDKYNRKVDAGLIGRSDFMPVAS